MDKYLNRLRNEQKKRVRFNIVEDNARFHSSMEVQQWTSSDRRLPLRRHHSNPIVRRRFDNKEDKATVRWNSESSSCAAPLKCPKRKLSSPGGDRWRVSRNNSDSIIHSPPKRRFTSPSSPMLMLASLNCKALLSKSVDNAFPSSPPLQTKNGEILDEAVREIKADVVQTLDDSINNSENHNSGNDDESIPLVQTRKAVSPQQLQQQQDESSDSTNLKTFFGLLNLMFLWSLWNAFFQYISTSIFRRNENNEKKNPGHFKDEQNNNIIEQMEQGEASPLVFSSQPHNNSPTAPSSPYSLSVL